MERNIERYRPYGFGSIFGVDPYNPFPGRRGLIDNLFDNGFSLSGLTDIFDADFGVKVVEGKDRKEYHFGLPGIDKENIAVDVSGHVLSVKVDQKDEKSSREFSSKVTLSSDLDVEKAEAESKNGLLIVSFPYNRRNSFKVEVTAGANDGGKVPLTGSGNQDEISSGNIESNETLNKEQTESGDTSTEGVKGWENDEKAPEVQPRM
jgi:HSP20 family molecular chaperone IbpA